MSKNRPPPIRTSPGPYPACQVARATANLDLTQAGARRISRPMSSAETEKDSDELDPDEPRTPMWLPLLGGGLFLLALLLFLATRSDEEPIAEDTADTAA